MKQKTAPTSSLQKALRVLLAFQPERPTWGVRELSSHLGYSPATVQRFLRTLREYSFVDQDPETRSYRLGNVFFQFLHVLQSTYPITRAAKPFMRTLSAHTQETVHLNLVEGTERICIDSVESLQNLKASMPIGEKSPLYAGASSKCLLAFSTDDFIEDYLTHVEIKPLTERTLADVPTIRRELLSIRKQGYATSLGERSPGLGSLSAPVFDHSGVLLAAISMAIPELRYQNQQHREFCLKALLETAAMLSKSMGFRGAKSTSGAKR